MISNLISVCCFKDIQVWKTAAPYIIKNIKAKKYTLIVPDSELRIFKKNSPKKYSVISETKIDKTNILEILKQKIPPSEKSQIGWYYQQFIKIIALGIGEDEDFNVIWDADTIPLRRLNFISGEKIEYFVGDEYHPEYFNCIKRCLGLKKLINKSFIAQCFPARAIWIRKFIYSIEKKFNSKWYQVILNNINFNVKNAFSEYETLGTFIYKHYKEDIKFKKDNWNRFGYSTLGSLDNLTKNTSWLRKKYAFIAFEKWDKDAYFYNQFHIKLFAKIIPKWIKLFLKKIIYVITEKYTFLKNHYL